MENTTQKTNIRWLYLAVGTFAMLFAGILYAWSILKAPFSVEFGWSPSDLTLNFTITMSFFLHGRPSGRPDIQAYGFPFCHCHFRPSGLWRFCLDLSSDWDFCGSAVPGLWILAGLGIGISYNVVVATVSAWFPDKKRDSAPAA